MSSASRRRYGFVVSLLLAFSSAAWGEDSSVNFLAQIGSIDGASTITVVREGKKLSGGSGFTLEPADRIVTGEEVTATVRLADGSVLVVGRGSELTVSPARKAYHAISLSGGTVRGLVPKINKLGSQAPKREFRFTIRARSVVMGVRGTDFILRATGDSETLPSELYTLEGTVDVAPTEIQLETGGDEVIRVGAGETVRATPDGIDAPRTFVPEELIQNLSSSQPVLAQVAPAPSIEAEAAETETPQPSGIPLRFALINFEEDKVAQKGGIGLSLNPYLWGRADGTSLRAQVGVFVVGPDQRESSEKGYLALDSRIELARVFFGRLVVGGVGSLALIGSHGLAPGIGMHLGLRFPKPLFGFLERFFVSPSILTLQAHRVSEFRLGFELVI